MATRRTKINIRAIHATFSAIFQVIGGFFLVAPIIFVNYEVIFQSGLAGFLIGIAYLMASMMLTGKEICLTRGQFYLLNRHIILLVFSAGAHILVSAYYLWNLIKILLLCGNFENDAVSQHTESLLSIASLEKSVQTTSLTEDQDFQLARSAKICRNEYGFTMFLVILLIIADLLCLVTIFVYIWIRCKLRCLYPCLVPHCG